MLWPVLISGFTLGMAGSLHCVGMCGPLSLALPIHHLSKSRKLAVLLLYQFGRIITYSFIGLLFGLAGRRIYISGHQQTFSIILGSIILMLSIIYFIGKRTIHFSLLNRLYMSVQGIIARLLRSSQHPAGFLLMGMANGLLPCGMIYIALTATLSFSTVLESVGFMGMFGAGTLPAMMMVGFAGQLIKPAYRISLQKLVPVFISCMGVILILRGMNLGIPFISPRFPAMPGTALICHP